MHFLKNRALALFIALALIATSIPLTSGWPLAETVIDDPAYTDSSQEDENGSVDQDEQNSPESLPSEEDYDNIQAQVRTELEENPNVNYVEGEVIVVFVDELTATEASAILKDMDTVDEGSLSKESMVADDMAVVELTEEATVFEAIAELNDNPEVAYAQPNYLYELFDADTQDEEEPWEATEEGFQPFGGPDNPDALDALDALDTPDGSQSQGDLTPAATAINDTYRGSQWALSTTRLFDTWSLTRANRTVTVAVVDTGVMTNHEDLASCIIPGTYYDATGTGQVGDPHGHGTHVAGIIAAEANNARGIAGTSYNARIIPICTGYYYNGFYTMNTVAVCNAYDYLFTVTGSNGQTRAQQYNLKVINISLGGTGIDPALRTRIDQAYQAGVLTVASAGNDRTSVPYYPGSFENCINVSGLKQGVGTLHDEFDSSYSNYGQTVNLSAPGTAIFSTTYDGSYNNKQGTSMSAAYVSGVAALVFAANPSATPAQVRAALQNTAVDLGTSGWDQYYGYGEVNPYAATLAVAVTGITNETPQGIGRPITCSVVTTLPMATTWQWSVVSGPGTITSNGILTPSQLGTITVMATYTGDNAVYTTKNIVIANPGTATITYSTHVQNYGWIGSSPSNSLAANGDMSGTSGRSLRLEALQINLTNNTGISGGIAYSAHVQNVGWQNEVNIFSAGTSSQPITGGVSGTTGRTLRLEALRIRLTGNLATYYDVYYRAHVQSIGWMGWAKNGEDIAGTVGLALRLEAIQIYLVPAGSTKPGDSFRGVTTISAGYPCAIDVTAEGQKGKIAYNAMLHIQNWGDVNYLRANGSQILGTTGLALRLEAMRLTLLDKPVQGGLTYSVHIQDIGWQGLMSENQIAGTSGRALRLEAIRINLTGALANDYDVYYRTHIQNIGWTGWAKNGQSCGSAGYSFRMEAMQIVIVNKGGTAPGSNSSYFYQR